MFSQLFRTRVLKYEGDNSGELLMPTGGLHGESCLSGKLGTYRYWNLTSKMENSNFHRFILGLIRSQ